MNRITSFVPLLRIETTYRDAPVHFPNTGWLKRDVSSDFFWNKTDAAFCDRLFRFEGSPQAVAYFAAHCKPLTSYAYWYLLGVLWVSYTGFSDLALWKSLFASTRKNRATSLMKPSERRVLLSFADEVTIYRAHRVDETDWIAYTLNPRIAARFAAERGVSEVLQYAVDKSDIFALFLRRGEEEVLVLDKARVRLVRSLPVVEEARGSLLTILEFELMGKVRLMCDFVKLPPTRTPDGRVCLLYHDAGLRLRKAEILPDGEKPGLLEYRIDGSDAVYSFKSGCNSSEIIAVTDAIVAAIRTDAEAARVLDARHAKLTAKDNPETTTGKVADHDVQKN